ncbi:hypothetical protein EDC38_0386 [Marinimicrobium koreense]|uniref:Uncharacterized protein n=1 Tax=Marinimicrobium koreense TaxID=306545 RepID=A0A3N1NWY3_9GAMM|nr:hypothetical protein [Marinimicrobium koreense]ROQ19798.1 hypothetical protein EDC38_0386 [Marinimicrobium koreense]
MQTLRNKKHIIVPVIIVTLIILGWSAVFDNMAKEFTNKGLLQAGAFFGTIRFLNAVVSMFQEVEISFIVTSLSIGQLLDPINDLVEYVSDGLKIAIGSYLLQRTIVEITSTALFNILFTVAGFGYIASFFLFAPGVKTLLFKVFMTALFLRFSVVLIMFATTAFSASFLDEKIESEKQKTTSLSAELDDSRRAAENVSEELLERITVDIAQVENEKEAVIGQIQPRQEAIRENRYALSKRESELRAIKQTLGVMDSLRGNDDVDRLRQEINELEIQNDRLAEEIDELNQRVDFLDEEIERAESHLYEESNGFLKMLGGGVGAAWDYISNLASGLVDSTMSALVLLLFKMLLLPIGFLYALLKGFKAIWGLELSEAGGAADQELRHTFEKNKVDR